MKRYKLLKDLPGVKAGTTLRTGEQVYNELYNDDDGRPTGYRLIPNGDISGENPLLHSPASDWLEEIPEGYKRWRTKEGGQYWFVEDDGGVANDCDDWVTDDRRYEFGNYFKTKEEAQKASDWLKAFTILRDDTKGFKPDWEDPDQKVWTVRYDRCGGKLVIDFFIQWDFGSVISFATKADAEASIENHERQWLTFFNVEG